MIWSSVLYIIFEKIIRMPLREHLLAARDMSKDIDILHIFEIHLFSKVTSKKVSWEVHGSRTIGCNTFMFESAKQNIFKRNSRVYCTFIFFFKETFRGCFAGLWHIHFFKEIFRGGRGGSRKIHGFETHSFFKETFRRGFAGLWYIHFLKEMFRGGGRGVAKVSLVYDSFLFQSEEKKICGSFVGLWNIRFSKWKEKDFGGCFSGGGGSRDCDTFIFSKKYFAGRGVAGWRAQASKVLCSFIELAKRARLSARERKGMTKLMLKLENTYFFEKHVRLGARSHSKPLLHYTTINDRAHFSERM